jgi:hypothetical protein
VADRRTRNERGVTRVAPVKPSPGHAGGAALAPSGARHPIPIEISTSSEVSTWARPLRARMATARIVQVQTKIVLLRGERVILDADLAALYGVALRALNQSVHRNRERFPEDFMFQLTKQEAEILRSQSVISSWGGRRYLPFAFTEQGVARLSSVLRSAGAVQVNVEIMRAFVRLRSMLGENAELARKLAALEKKYDAQFRVVFDAIRELMTPATSPKDPIGFQRRSSKLPG